MQYTPPYGQPFGENMCMYLALLLSPEWDVSACQIISQCDGWLRKSMQAFVLLTAQRDSPFNPYSFGV